MFIETLSRSGCLPKQLQLALKRKITESNCTRYFNACKKPFATLLCLKKLCLWSEKREVLSYNHALWYSSNPSEDSSQRNLHQKKTGVRYDPDWNSPCWDQEATLSSVLLCRVNQQKEDLALRFLSVHPELRMCNSSVNFMPIVQQHQFLRAR